MSSPAANKKIALITTGATYPFASLVAASLDLRFLSVLASAGYTTLRIQHGKAPLHLPSTPTPLQIEGFDFVEDIRPEIAAADLVISHAGAGSILDALRYQKPCVVVPNTDLMGNHQEELADELQRQGYVVWGECGGLGAAVKKAEGFPFTQFPESGSRKFVRILDEEMGMFELD